MWVGGGGLAEVDLALGLHDYDICHVWNTSL